MRNAAYRAVQPSFDDLGVPLAQATFVVVDLETTGGASEDSITEFGAVKVRGGEVLGEFQTLVNPDVHIPALIAVLTGITDAMVADAPRLAAILPSFLEFARGSVLVAHNAGFDVGFLKRACAAHGQAWPGFMVVDTVALARNCLLRDEVPNFKLSTLAPHFRATTTPNHRALDDARATVDVLHGLFERLGNLGVHTLEDLDECTRRVSPERRAKRTWAASLPSEPGVYCMVSDRSDKREVLYVGKSVNIRARVRTYFTAAEKRGRMEEMIRVATGVEAFPCATPLEAEVRELRMIAAHHPRYNRRSRNQDRLMWVKLTQEPFPRLAIVRQVRCDGADYIGPFSSRAGAEDVVFALQDAFPLRQCAGRLSARTPTSGCALGEMGRCHAPCRLGERAQSYSTLIDQVREALQMDTSLVLSSVGERMTRLVRQERFEEAQILKCRLEAYSQAAVRIHRLRALAACRQIVAAEATDDEWHIHVIRYGRLAGAARSEAGQSPVVVARDAEHLAETVLEPPTGLPAASVEEAERIAAWLQRPGVRLIDVDGEWAWPVRIGSGLRMLSHGSLGVAAAGAEDLGEAPGMPPDAHVDRPVGACSVAQ